MWSSVLLVCALIPLTICVIDKQFPPWFKFGSASSSYQIEGAWNVGGKTESKWDHITHMYPHYINDLSNGDVACDSYFQWERDVEMVAELALQFYRFSISWPRLLSHGFANIINEDGKRYYNNLIDGLLAKGIEPVITIYHFEMPKIFQDLGGWTNPSMVDWYADYARVVFTLFGDRVKTWITINEPQIECDGFHGPVSEVTLGLEHNVAAYLCSKYILMAHAKAWRIYDEEFRHKFNGKISLSNHLIWLKPYSSEYENLTKIALELITGRYSHAVYSKEGGWPPVIEEVIEKVSKQLGYSTTRLPPFTKEEIELVKGTYDFYGMNHYTTRLLRSTLPYEKTEGLVFVTAVPEINAIFDSDPTWVTGFNKDLPINPVGIRQQMHWLQKQYGDIEIILTENGLSSTGSNLKDDERISFIKAYLEQVLISIDEGINVTSYTYWSLMDGFEFFDGYTSKFGLYEVDFADKMRKRTPRASAIYYRNVLKKRSLTFRESKIDHELYNDNYTYNENKYI